MDSAGVTAAWKVAERQVKGAYGDTARIVRHVPMYPTSAPALQMEPTLPLAIWVFDTERNDGQALMLIASRSSQGWSVVETA